MRSLQGEKRDPTNPSMPPAPSPMGDHSKPAGTFQFLLHHPSPRALHLHPSPQQALLSPSCGRIYCPPTCHRALQYPPPFLLTFFSAELGWAHNYSGHPCIVWYRRRAGDSLPCPLSSPLPYQAPCAAVWYRGEHQERHRKPRAFWKSAVA